jgi:hypothetical protein
VSQAEIRMPVSEWQDLHDAKQKLEGELASTLHFLDDARLDKGTGDARALADAIITLLPVIRFAIAHLEPRMFRGWPHAELRAFVELLPDLPGLPMDLRETANDWKLFCEEAKRWEDARAEGKQFEILAEENAVRGMSIPDAHGKMGATVIDGAEAAGAARLIVEP